MLYVFSVAFQVHKPNDSPAPGAPGCAVDAYRKPEEDAVVVSESDSAIPSVITENVKLETGERVDVVQIKRLAQGVKKVFVQRQECHGSES